MGTGSRKISRFDWNHLVAQLSSSREWSGVWLGLGVLAGCVAIDAAIGGNFVLFAGFAVAAFVPAAFGGRAATLLVAVAVMVAALGSQIWHPTADPYEVRIQIFLTFFANLLALQVARVRHQARRGFERLEILTRIAQAANSSLATEETLRIVESIVVPAFADFYMIDRVYHEEGGGVVIERASVSVSGPKMAEVLPILRDRRSSVPPAMIASDAGRSGHSVVLVPKVTEEKLVEIARGPEDLEFLRSLGMNSYLHVTLQARGEVLGVLTMAVAWSGRYYDEDDAAFAQVLAGRIALALDNAGLFTHLRRIESRLDTAMAVLDEAIVMHESEGNLIFANQAAARLFGAKDVDQLVKASPRDVDRWCRFYLEDGTRLRYDNMRVLRAADPDSRKVPAILRAEIGPERREIWLRPRVKTVLDAEGKPLFTVAAIEDITEIKRAEYEQKLLGRSAELLSSADDYEGILRMIAEILVPMLADGCAVDVLEYDGDWRRVALKHKTPGAERASIETAESRLQVDLLVGGQRVGVVTLVRDAGNRELTEVDRDLAVRFLDRVGIALEKARLTADRAEIAASLQQGLIPQPLPNIDGWELAALYRPAGELNEVGGDFYETFGTAHGQVVVIGDVVGRGARAASITAQARYTLRTAGQISQDPAVALAALNRALLSRDDGALCSAVVVVLNEGGQTVDLMVAGHPLPLKVGEAGVIPTGINGPILGAFDGVQWPVERVAIEPGERLLLHTDGVTESEQGGERFGEPRLWEALRIGGSGPTLLSNVEHKLREFVPGPPRDDVAMLTISHSTSLPGTTSEQAPLIEQLCEMFNRRSESELIELCDPEVELSVPTAALAGRESGSYHGYEGVHQFTRDIGRIWDDLLITPHEVVDYGDWVLVSGRIYARSRAVGMRDLPVIWLWKLRDGRFLKGLAFMDLDRALSFARPGVG